MPIVQTAAGTMRFCVLIPTRGRAALLRKSLNKMPWLDDEDTILGIEYGELDDYRAYGFVEEIRWSGHTVTYHNPRGSVAVAREKLRRYAMSAMWATPAPEPAYTHFVVTDDNAIHASKESLHNLVRACAEWPRPCVMAGFHNTAKHFDRNRIAAGVKTKYGLRSYAAVAAIFQCYPRSLYEPYTYPEESYGLDDRHYFLWLLARGHTEFRVCMDAPFTKSRYQQGGQGSLEERAEKCGRAIARLAGDFPALVGAVGTLRIPWQHIIKTVNAGGRITGNRLVGGAMRKETTLQKRTLVKVRKSSPHGR